MQWTVYTQCPFSASRWKQGQELFNLSLCTCAYVLFHPNELKNNYEMFYMTWLCVAASEDEKEPVGALHILELR